MDANPPRSQPTITPLQLAVRALLFAVAYFVAAELVYFMRASQDLYAPFWPASGLFIAALLINPRKYWWVFGLAGYAANVLSSILHQPPALILFGYPTGDILEAVVAAYLILRAQRKWPLDTFFATGLLAVVGAVVAGTAINATLCATIIHTFDPQKQFIIHWFQWWSGDIIGILVMTPLIMYWKDFSLTAALQGERSRKTRSLLIISACLAVWLAIFFYQGHWMFSQKAITTLFLVAAAIWLTPRTFSVLGLFYTLIAIWAALFYPATIVSDIGDTKSKILFVQTFVTIGLSLSYIILLMNLHRERKERALRESEARYRVLFETSQDAIFVMGKDDCILDCNPRTEELFGYTREELLRQRPYDLSPDFQPDGSKTAARAVEKTHAAHSVGPQFFEWRHLRADGTVFDAEVNLQQAAFSGMTCLFATVRDITERKQIEEWLRILQHSVDIQTDSVYWFDSQNRLIYVNDSACTVLGYTREELKEIDIETISPTATPERMREVWDELRTQGHFKLETRHRRKDGSTFPVEIVSTYLRSGESEYNCGYARDITERKAAEAALRESEEKFRQIFEEGPLGMFHCDAHFRITAVNSAFCRMVGYTEGELTALAFIDITHPDHVADDLAAAEQLFSGEIPIYRTQKRYVRKDGEIVWCALTVTVMRKHNGEFFYFLAMVDDITNQKRALDALQASEVRFRTLIEDSSAAIGIVRDGINTYGNARLAEMFGFRTPADVIGQPVLALIAPSHHTEARARTRRRQEGLATENTYETVGLRQDGSEFPLHVSITTLNLAGGPAQVAFCTDLTVLKKAEHELRDSHERLKQLTAHIESVREEERRWVAREVHDELGQVLTAMRYDLAWLKKRLPDDQTILADKTTAMDVLLQSAMQSVKKISSRLRPIPIEQMGMENALEWLIQDFAQRTSIVCSWILDIKNCALNTELGTAVYRILQEALTNIARHAQATHVKINLTCKDESIVLRVDDDGVGFDLAAIDGKKSFGLIGIRERAQFFGGRIEIKSQPGSGTALMAVIPFSIQGAKHDSDFDRG